MTKASAPVPDAPTPHEILAEARRVASKTRAERRREADREFNAAVAVAYKAYSEASAAS